MTEDETNETNGKAPAVGNTVDWNALTGVIVQVSERNACIDWRDGGPSDWWPLSWLVETNGSWRFAMPPPKGIESLVRDKHRSLHAKLARVSVWLEFATGQCPEDVCFEDLKKILTDTEGEPK